MAPHMEVNEFTFGQNAAVESLFSPAISSDSWVLYHATTSVAEERIDTEGLIPSLDHDVTLIKLIKVFRAMNWAGENGAGYPVLRGFSLQRARFQISTSGNLVLDLCSTQSPTLQVERQPALCTTAGGPHLGDANQPPHEGAPWSRFWDPGSHEPAPACAGATEQNCMK